MTDGRTYDLLSFRVASSWLKTGTLPAKGSTNYVFCNANNGNLAVIYNFLHWLDLVPISCRLFECAFDLSRDCKVEFDNEFYQYKICFRHILSRVVFFYRFPHAVVLLTYRLSDMVVFGFILYDQCLTTFNAIYCRRACWIRFRWVSTSFYLSNVPLMEVL